MKFKMGEGPVGRFFGTIAAALFAAAAAGFSPAPAESASPGRVFIDIYSPSARKIRLAIPELRPLDGRRDPLGLRIAELIESDLRRSGLFFIRDRKGFLENPIHAPLRKDKQRFREWSKLIKVEGLIKGGYRRTKNSLDIEMYLYDVVRGTLSNLDQGYSQSVEECLADDLTSLSLDDQSDPQAGQGFWFLVRAVNCAGSGSYASGGIGEQGPRDSGIDSSLAACP